MQFLEENKYLLIDRNSMSTGQIALATELGFKLTTDGYYKAQDDAVRRSILGLPLPEVKEKEDLKTGSLTTGQIETMKNMVSTGTYLNANQMGLGKTYETIMAIENLDSDLNLIICPKFVRSSWRNELVKWLDLDPNEINIIEGTPKERLEASEGLKRYNIINYELLRNYKDPAVIQLTKTKWDTIVADEAHRLKNRKAKQTKGVKRLKSKYRYALTGTPIQNKPDDLWSILNWLDPFLSGKSFWRFVETFCNVEEGFFGKEILGLTTNDYNIEALRNILNRIMSRRSSDKELPDRIDIPVTLELDPRHKKLYTKVKKDILIELDEDRELFINSGLVRLLRLQQTTSNPGLFDDKIINPKFKYVQELMEDNEETKFLVFSRFKQTIYALQKELGDKSVVITGDTEDIDLEIESFKKPGKQVLLATIGAIGEGVNGLQHISDTVIFIDKDWSPAVNSQAVGRLVRKGQKNNVKVYDVQIENTIDEYVEKLLNMKKEDIEKVIR